MRSINPTALKDAFPRLRERVESSRLLAQSARQRASHAAEQALAMRQLLKARTGRWTHAGEKDRDIWEAAAEEILRASMERDRALGILAHELRQPLAAALAAHRLLALQPDTAIGARASAVLERQLLQLTKLVDGLLDFSRLALGSVTVERSPIDIRDVVARAVESVEGLVSRRNQRLTARLGDATLTVSGDLTRLGQVFSNLLHNAVRYTPDGGHILVVAEAAGFAVSVRVSDDGAGIAPDLQPVIFEPFTRGSGEGKGLGIGLALARTIVELHGGQIQVTSDGPGCGSTFTVTLPAMTR